MKTDNSTKQKQII